MITRNQAETLLKKIPNYLRKQFNYLFEHNIGLFPSNYHNIKVNCFEDHISCKIPIAYAEKTLNWEVIFNLENYSFPPDFNFNDDEFHDFCTLENLEEEVTSYVEWNFNKASNLLETLKQFLLLYKRYQVEKLYSKDKYSRILEEFVILQEQFSDMDFENIESLVENNVVFFLVKLKYDISDIVHQYLNLQSEKKSKADAFLGIYFIKLNVSELKVDVKVPKKFLNLFDDDLLVNLPDFEPSEQSVAQYIELLLNKLKDGISEMAFNLLLKREFILSVLAQTYKNVIEYDGRTFNFLYFLEKYKDYTAIVQLLIGNNFPAEKPVVRLKSIYCKNPYTKQACSRTVKIDFKISSDAYEMAESVLSQIRRSINEFKNHHAS